MLVYVSIGSNVDPAANVRRAVDALRQVFSPVEVSPVYRTAAIGFDGDDFLNLVAGFDTEFSVEAVSEKLAAIEMAAGRDRAAPRFAPRTLDIDLLLYGDAVINRDGIRVPRSEITQYAFMLMPLVDIAGERLHPQVERSFAELLAAGDFSGQRCERIEMIVG
jgi:2-amino-4-hydroxy-6-hydroxymethyldihydropteridine diphosphokinase